MNVRKHLEGVPLNNFFVFDSKRLKFGEGKYNDKDYVAYNYNVHQFSKPRAGDFFLYREPAGSRKDHKFIIYGGGVISKIINEGENGNVMALVEKPFQLANPLIQQDSEKLEKFVWSKPRKTETWKYFLISME